MTNKQPHKVYSNVTTSNNTYDIYLVGPILAPEYYIEEFQALKMAQEGDTINIIINSVGGQVNTAMQFVENIKQCQGLVTAYIEGECHSAASYIFLACDGWSVPEWAIMMVHNYSGGHYGKGGEVVQAAQETDKWINRISQDSYTPFLTKKEIKKLKKGQDFWFMGEQIAKRLERVVESREEYNEEQRKEQLKTVKAQLEGLAANERDNS